jgi:hypothetical protein
MPAMSRATYRLIVFLLRGMIFINMHGRLANNLFEVVFATRIAEQLDYKIASNFS